MLTFFPGCVAIAAEPDTRPVHPVPLFDSTTELEPDTTQKTDVALITHDADRVRDRHAREKDFHAYDHYLSWYWEERTIAIEIVDQVARGGQDITVNMTSLAPLDEPNFRCFFRGINTVAEYHHNVIAQPIGPNHYSTTIRFNSTEQRGLKPGDHMAFEFSPFLTAPRNGRSNYYGSEMLYIVGRGIVPWQASGSRLISIPLPQKAWLGGHTTLSYQYSDEPRERFNQMAANMSPAGAQPFMLGRRLHHTDFGDGSHSEQPNPSAAGQAGKLGPQFVARSCIACHVNNGRAPAPQVDAPMYQTVVKVGRDAAGTPHPLLGSSLQPQAINREPEAIVRLAGYTTRTGIFTDGTPYSLRKPIYDFDGVTPRFFSVRLTPALVGLGLLEAVAETTILDLADPDDTDGDGVSGRMQIVRDPETGQPRLGRFGYKAGQARLRHQIASALNSDMGVTTSVFPALDNRSAPIEPELSEPELMTMTRYITGLGVSARRNLADPAALHGEQLFATAGCVKCHTPELVTSPHYPFPELRSQAIQPYTDLLLHDMGPALADNMGEHIASGAEWRTPPLWSIGLTADVGGSEVYLHDGRARSLAEAILWHGGEAEAAKEVFRSMTASDRAALITFLKSL